MRGDRGPEQPGRAQRAGGALARAARPCPAAPWHRSHPRRTTGRRSAAARGAAAPDDSTRPMSKPAGSTWPSPRSNGAACATRCRQAVSARRVEVRQEVEGSSIEIRWAAEHVATHAISDIEGMEVWDACHFAEAQSGRPLAQSGPPPQHRRARRSLPRDGPAPTRHCRETSTSRCPTWPAMRPRGPGRDQLPL